MSKESVHVDVDAAFDPELRQARQDYAAFRHSVPFERDENGNIHDAQDGQFVEKEETYSYFDKLREAHEQARNVPYEDMSAGDLARKFAEAYHYNDQTTAHNVSEILDKKIGEMQENALSQENDDDNPHKELGIYDKDFDHNADRMQAIRDRVYGIAEKHLAELEGKTTEPTDPEPAPRSEPEPAPEPEPTPEPGPEPTTEPGPADGGSGDGVKPAQGEVGEPLGSELQPNQQRFKDKIEELYTSLSDPTYVPTIEQFDELARWAARIKESGEREYFGPYDTQLEPEVAEALLEDAKESAWIVDNQEDYKALKGIYESVDDPAALTEEQRAHFDGFKDSLPDDTAYDTDKKAFDAFKAYVANSLALSDALTERRQASKKPTGTRPVAVKRDWDGTRAQREEAYVRRDEEHAPLPPTRSEKLKQGMGRIIGAVSLKNIRRTTEVVEDETAYKPSQAAVDAFLDGREAWNHTAVADAWREREARGSRRPSGSRWQALRDRYRPGSERISDAAVSTFDQLRLRLGTMSEEQVAFRATRRGIQQDARRRNR